MGHRVSCVDGKVQDDLFDLTRIDENSAKGRGREQGKFDRCAQQTPEHFLHAQNGLAEVEHLRLEHLFATEREELPREIRRPLSGTTYFLDVGASGIVWLQVIEEQRCEAQDDGQHVVEIVRHAAR
jgi:hypothetical protein